MLRSKSFIAADSFKMEKLNYQSPQKNKRKSYDPESALTKLRDRINIRAKHLVHQPKCNCLVTNQGLIVTFSIRYTFFPPPSVCECVDYITHLPVFIIFPT